MDYAGLLIDGVTQGLLYAPPTIAFALLYAHAHEIDISIDTSVVIAGIAFGLLLEHGVGVLFATVGGIATGAAVSLATGAIHLYLGVPFLVGGLIVSFMGAAMSTYLVGERLSLLEMPRIFVTPPLAVRYLWLPALAILVVRVGWSVRRALRSARTVEGDDRRPYLALIYTGGLSGLVVLGVAGGSSAWAPPSLRIALVFAVAVWLIAAAFHYSDLGLADRAVGSNVAFRLRRDWRVVRMGTLVLVGIITGSTGVVLAQYKAQAVSGGSFNIVIGALASYVLFDRVAAWSRRRRDSLEIGDGRRGWWFAALSVVADTSPTTRGLLGCMVFYTVTQLVIAFVGYPELPRLFIGAFLLAVLADWRRAFARGAGIVENLPSPPAPESSPPVLVVRDVWKGYPRGAGTLSVLRGADFTMGRADRVVRISGPNAAGKSTLFRIIDGELQPDRGECSVLGLNITFLPRSARPVFLITQNPFETIACDLTVNENLRLAMLRRYRPASGLHVNDWEGRATEILQRYGLWNTIANGGRIGMNTLAGNLSGGQAQCLAFAMAAAYEPALILADEPTANLDPQNTNVILDLIQTLSNDFPILLISHDERVARVAKRTYALERGRLVECVEQAEIDRTYKEESWR